MHPEAPILGAVIEGLQLAQGDDDALLAEGITLFEALYRTYEQMGHGRSGPDLLHARDRRRPRSKLECDDDSFHGSDLEGGMQPFYSEENLNA